MKNSILFSILFFCSFAMKAQQGYTLSEGNAVSNGSSKSFTTTLSGFQIDFVSSQWINFLQQYNGKSCAAVKN